MCRTGEKLWNSALKALTSARCAQFDSIYIDRFQSDLHDYLSESTGRSIWGVPEDPILDSALTLLILLEGICSMRIAGGVAETRFYYEEMRLVASVTANMLPAWDKIEVSGIGKKHEKYFKTLNSMVLKRSD